MNLLLADDLTGCCDAAVKFLTPSNTVRIALAPASAASCAVPARGMLAVNTDSRALPAPESARINYQVAQRLKGELKGPSDLVYKKLDSTLRGNPGPEIAAIADALGSDAAIIAPAAPSLGRTVRNGVLAVNGVPLARTVFGKDPGSPMLHSEVGEILGDLPDAAPVTINSLNHGENALAGEIQALLAQGVRYLILDSLSQADLDLIARVGLAMRPQPLFAGSAGLAQALAVHSGRMNIQKPALKLKRILFVCGSANQATHAQLREIENAGIQVLYLDPALSPASISANASRLAELLRKDSACVATTQARIGAEEAAEQIRALALITRLVLDERIGPGFGLFLTGGETAFATLRNLADCMTLKGELMPGIVLGELAGGQWRGLPVITKAGGFGPASAFLDLIKLLT